MNEHSRSAAAEATYIAFNEHRQKRAFAHFEKIRSAFPNIRDAFAEAVEEESRWQLHIVEGAKAHE